MLTFDLALLIILGLFALLGLISGFIQALGTLLGVLLGAFVAGHYYQLAAGWGSFLWGDGNWGRLISFFLILIIVSRLVGLLFYLVNRIFEIISIIPFLKTINRLVGLVFGLLEGLCVVSLTVYFLSQYPVSAWLTAQMATSAVAPWLLLGVKILLPLLPGALKQAEQLL
ncbi:MAG: CvpA family protein [Patescibacteria group bacterium]|jgi:uncharacterized membrane protein required for colicin V production